MVFLFLTATVLTNKALADTYSQAWTKKKPFVVMFYTTWCPTCQQFMPHFSKISSKFSGKLPFVKVDMDQAPALQAQYNITLVPTVYLINPKNTKKQKMSMQDFLTEQAFIDSLEKGLKSIK